MEQKIKEIMASVFNCDVSEINENTSPDTINNWDSLRHMHLIAALEEDFNVTFKEDEILDMLNYKLIYQTLLDKNIS